MGGFDKEVPDWTGLGEAFNDTLLQLLQLQLLYTTCVCSVVMMNNLASNYMDVES